MKKKILFLIPNLAHGGAERVLVNAVNNLNPQKYDVTVQTLFDVGVNRQYLLPHVHYIPGYKRQPRGTTALMKIFPPRMLYKFWIKDEYDILISYLEGPTSRIIAGCPDCAKKRIAWFHIELNTPKQASVGFRSVAEAQKLYNSYDRLIAVADSVKQRLLLSMPLKTPISVLYNTNETETILEKAKKEPEDSAFFKEGFRVCSVAKLMQTKGFDRLLNVHKRLIDEGIKHTVYILGVGEEEENLRQKIKEYHAEDTFVLLGYKENPYQYVSRCDLYVCSSRREGFSTAVTEALIVGTPVVSTNCSGAKELLGENNEYGLVVENSEDGIYEGMKKMLSDPQMLIEYRRAAAERGKYFRKEKTIQALEDMLENL